MDGDNPQTTEELPIIPNIVPNIANNSSMYFLNVHNIVNATGIFFSNHAIAHK